MVGLVVLFVAVAGVNVVYQRQASMDNARQAALGGNDYAAQTAAREIAADLGAARAQVAALAAQRAIGQAFGPAAAGCTLQFGGDGAFGAGHIDIIRADGTVTCSSLRLHGSYRGARWLAGALAGPVLTGPITDARTGRQAVVAAAPVPGKAPVGTVAAFLDLAPLGPALATELGGSVHREFVLTTADGAVVVARSIQPGAWAGKPVAGTPFAGAAGQAEHRDVDGTLRLYGQAVVPGIGWRVFAGESASATFGAANALSDRQILITLAGLAVLFLATLVLYRRIARPIAILGAGVRAATAHLPAGPVPVAGPQEVAALAQDVNQLISAASRELEARSQVAAIAEDRRELEHRLRQSERLESLGQLASGIAHDFNNLLAAIMNYAAFAEQTTEKPDVRADVQQIQAAAERAARLTRQLLTFARREPAQPQTLDLNAVVDDVRNLLSRTIGAHIELAVETAADLPAITADRGQTEQVLLNLAINARDAMPGGGVLTIRTGLAELDDSYSAAHPGAHPGRYVGLTVADTGTGMSAEVISHIFDPFFTTKPEGQGTGLGLSTVYGIVTGAGGSVSVDSAEGAGTTFRLYFPAAAAAAAPPTADRASSPRVWGDGQTILVVDDEPAVLAATARILRQNGYATLEAGSYEQAIALAAANQLQLLLTDSVMPQMSGAALADRITGIRPGLPVVYMSGYSAGALDPADPPGLPGSPGSSPGGGGPAARIQKPFTSQTLLQAIERALNPS